MPWVGTISKYRFCLHLFKNMFFKLWSSTFICLWTFSHRQLLRVVLCRQTKLRSKRELKGETGPSNQIKEKAWEMLALHGSLEWGEAQEYAQGLWSIGLVKDLYMGAYMTLWSQLLASKHTLLIKMARKLWKWNLLCLSIPILLLNGRSTDVFFLDKSWSDHHFPKRIP